MKLNKRFYDVDEKDKRAMAAIGRWPEERPELNISLEGYEKDENGKYSRDTIGQIFRDINGDPYDEEERTAGTSSPYFNAINPNPTEHDSLFNKSFDMYMGYKADAAARSARDAAINNRDNRVRQNWKDREFESLQNIAPIEPT